MVMNNPKHKKNEKRSDIVDYTYDKLVEKTFPLLDQDYVERWSGRHTIHRQNLAEHHGHVVQYCIALFTIIDIPDASQLRILKRAAVHDLPETELSDIPFPSHVKYPDLSEAYDHAEADVWKTKYADLNVNVDKASVEWKVVKIADRLDRLHFIKNEYQLGNTTSYMSEAYHEEVKAVYALIADVLSVYKLVNQEN